eukprot:4960577-Alexandrium_andersonii.AAC.1
MRDAPEWPWCAAPRCGVEHVIWRCPRFDAHRQQFRALFDGMPIGSLPPIDKQHLLPPCVAPS